MRPVPRVSRYRKPAEMTLEEWQAALRRQFGTSQPFSLQNVGVERVFSDFEVTNPASGRTYPVSIRGRDPGVNSCGCPDYATNLLGTCKHIEFVLARLSLHRWGRTALAKGFHPPFSSVRLVYGAQRQVVFHVGTSASSALKALAGQYFDEGGRLRSEAVPRFDEFVSAAGALGETVRVTPDVTGFLATRRAETARRNAVNAMFPDGTMSRAFEGLLKTDLHPYQREGALFACRTGRAILADEMGLGKTVQAIAAAEIGGRYLGVRKVLVVCPASLKHQWADEIRRFSSREAEVVYGGPRVRRQIYENPAFFTITGYDTLHSDLKLILAFQPDLVILDEAQRIKNWSTRAARSVKQITSPMALVLTGTPLENRLEELISIVQFVDQHRLGPTYRVLHEHQIRDGDTARVVGYTNLSGLADTLSPILLRRTKREVLSQLPPRTETKLFIGMTPAQQGLHDDNAAIVAKIVAKWRRMKQLSEADQKRLTIALQRMRMSCDSTFLLDEKSLHGRKPAEIGALLEDLLENPETKAVVFSQWIRMLDLVERECRKRSWNTVVFHGGVDTKDRGDLVRRFREDPDCRVFLSTDAGGTGLNLQAASAVVHADLPWNPAILEQRNGRVHRLGQRRPVQIFSLIAEKTIEEGMLSLIGFKQSLFAGILDGGENQVLLGGTRLNKFMESVESVTAPRPEPPPVPAPLPLPARGEPALSVDPTAEPSEAARSPQPADEARVETAPSPEADVAAEAGAQPEAVHPELRPSPPPLHPEPSEESGPGKQLPVSQLLSLAATFFQELAAGIAPPGGSGDPRPRPVWVEHDPATGESYVRVRLPERRVLTEMLRSLETLLKP
ncbi:MAG: DEAD/DEAH box helicase [Thermoanaerobaculia bacterium]|nr:DEAD/DEAH box helicase [Thermoanaerobaculia bacterium]